MEEDSKSTAGVDDRPVGADPERGGVALFGGAIFLAAALLFVVQPMVARMVLPRFGGSPEVWNTSMVFFQLALLAGYAYAHFTVQWLGVRRQLLLHGLVLVLPLLFLPVALPRMTVPPGAWQSPWILLLLTAAVGAPFFVLSTASPLLQRWFAATGRRGADDPYFLYAASNAGSLLGLLSYPFLVEPYLPLGLQADLWTVGYAVFVVLVVSCAVVVLREGARSRPDPSLEVPSGWPARPVGESRGRTGVDPSPSWRDRLFWVLCAFVPSSLLLAVTHYLTSEVAAIPLLWVVPLAVYLITYIVAFSRRVSMSPSVASRLMVVAGVALALTFLAGVREPVWAMLLLHVGALGAAGLLCHGRLAVRRPSAGHLTEFYLLVAVGGVLGGAFNALAAPLLFDDVFEYPLVLVVASFLVVPDREGDGESARSGGRLTDLALPAALGGFLALVRLGMERISGLGDGVAALLMAAVPALVLYLFSNRRVRFGLGMAVVLAFAFASPPRRGQVVASERTFFGVNRVVFDEEGRFHILFHGTTVHGVQSTSPSRADEPLGYYHPSHPGGGVVQRVTDRPGPRSVALVGLGTGALSVLAGRDDDLTFYEIDPAVVRIAEDPRYFTYLQRSAAEYDTVLGDGRIQLEQTDRRFDLVVLDAFSSASVPVHLLTREALQLYLDRLEPGGVLLFHVSSQHLELPPVLGALAADLGLAAAEAPPFEDPSDLESGILPSHWVMLARTGEDLGRLMDGRWRPLEAPSGTRVWTDDFADVLSVYRWN